jgi:hypothetical protein
MSSNHIKTEAIQNKIYMTALSDKEMVAWHLTELVQAYLAKYDYGYNDTFALKCLDLALKYHPNSILVLILKANILTQKVLKEGKLKHYPNFISAKKAPELKIIGDEIDKLYATIDNLGYEEMSKEEYGQMQHEANEEQKRQKANQK